jgi:hypothetical protein
MTPLLQARDPGTRDVEAKPPAPATRPATDPDRTLPVGIDAKGDYGFGVVVILLVVVAVGGMAAWFYLRRNRPPVWQTLPPPESDSEAFDRLCDANQLTRRERAAMAAMMQGMSGHERLTLFIDVHAFDRASAIATGSDQSIIQGIRRKLFSVSHG